MTYRFWLCGEDNGTRIVDVPGCLDADRHTPQPPGYLAWHEWAEGMAETHEQVRCPGCALWTIWEPKT